MCECECANSCTRVLHALQNIIAKLRGDDVPGSDLTITLRKHSSQQVRVETKAHDAQTKEEQKCVFSCEKFT